MLIHADELDDIFAALDSEVNDRQAKLLKPGPYFPEEKEDVEDER